jgi:hypothetical protein
MTIAADNPLRGRDLRLDLFRGLANWAIFLDHIPNNAVAWLTTRNYGFSDAADIFVFIVIVEEESEYHAWLEKQQTFAELSGRSAVMRATYKSGG